MNIKIKLPYEGVCVVVFSMTTCTQIQQESVTDRLTDRPTDRPTDRQTQLLSLLDLRSEDNDIQNA